MKILILEDEQRNAKRLIRLLNDIDRTFIVEGPLASIKETVEFFQSGKTTDLILADIRLTDGLSFEALKHAQATVPIIFTTAYDEYAVQAFKFNSFDYLLKPLDPDELEAAIDKAVKAGKNYTDENLQQLFDALQKSKFRYRERFLLPYRDGYKTVRVSDINHIETENKIVHLRLNNGTSEVVNVSMDELEHQLNPDYFFRANRQYIINVEHVLFLGNYFGGKLIVRLKGYPKTEIQVSKEKAQRLIYFHPFQLVLILNRCPTMTWSAMKLPVGLRSLAELRTKGTSSYTIESSRLCCHLASISLESSIISRLSFTRSMVHSSSL